MNECKMKGNKIEISEWYRGSFISVRREFLEPEHPQSFYSCLKRLGLRPEDYGYFRTCPYCSRIN